MSSTSYLQELPRWTQLSVRKQFVQRVQNAPVFFEETIKQNNKEPIYIELRIDGPFITTIGTRNEIEARIEVNALLCTTFDEVNTMKMYKLGGIVIAALTQSFCVFRLGDDVNGIDNGSYFETYQLITDDNVEMSNFGQIDSTNKIYQATVEAHYKMRFINGTV